MVFHRLEREDPRDVFISDKHKTLSEIETGIIGSSSPRRQAIIKHMNSNIKSKEMRGNIQTRLKKLKKDIKSQPGDKPYTQEPGQSPKKV